MLSQDGIELTIEIATRHAGAAVARGISPQWPKPAPNETQFRGCGPSGDGGDTLTNVRKNRTDVPSSYHEVAWQAPRAGSRRMGVMDTMYMDDARLRQAYEIAQDELVQALYRTIARVDGDATDEPVAAVAFQTAMQHAAKEGRRMVRLLDTESGRARAERYWAENLHIVEEIRRGVAHQRAMLELISPPPTGNG
jgi:hypothetical protein